MVGKALESYDNPDEVGQILIFVDVDWVGDGAFVEHLNEEMALNSDGSIDEKVDVSSSSDPEFLGSLVSGLKDLGVNIADGVINATKLVVDEVRTRFLRVAVKKDQDNAVGYDTFPAQQIEYRVLNSLIEQNSQVFITFRSDLGGRSWHVSEIAPGHGFTIRLSDVAVEPLDFSYWVVFVDELDGTQTTTTNNDPAPYCSDGNLDPGEECDDGNLVDGDGCDMTCMNETISDEPDITDVIDTTTPMLPVIEDVVPEAPVEEPVAEEPEPESQPAVEESPQPSSEEQAGTEPQSEPLLTQ